MPQARSSVGVDVSRARLDVAFPDAPRVWRTTNAPAGITALARRMSRLEAPQLVCEATGGDTRPLVRAMAANVVPLSRVDPRQVGDFGRATGRLAKTDAPFGDARDKLTPAWSSGSLAPCRRRPAQRRRPIMSG